MKNVKTIIVVLSILSVSGLAQSPQALSAGIVIKKIFSINNNAIRIVKDPTTDLLYYMQQNGSIYEVNIQDSTRTLKYSSLQHGQNAVQGFTIGPDGTFYVVGMNNSGGSEKGIIKRGKVEDPQRIWTTVAESEFYLKPNGRDHLFNAIEVTPDGNWLIVNSGSRTDHGESVIGGREFPITSAYFKIPVDAQDLFLYNDADSLAPYLFADGLRNSFDMAFSPEGELFATENGGARDDAEELNWIREGHHYGFPWRLANQDNSQQFTDFNPPDSDPLITAINMESTFYNDPTFPVKPDGIVFTDPVENLGPDADHYRDTTDAEIKDASEQGVGLYTFTPHSSPLAITFDNDQATEEPYTGDAFVMSYNDPSKSKYTPFNDPGGDLLHVELTKIAEQDRYTAVITRIAQGFQYPVDNIMVDNKIYVIEVGNGSSLWEVTLPAGPSAIKNKKSFPDGYSLEQNYPNPFNAFTIISFHIPLRAHVTVTVMNILGQEIETLVDKDLEGGKHIVHFNGSSLASGVYYYSVRTKGYTSLRKMLLIK